VAFTPAAGAASRYYTPLAPLVEALEQNDGKRAVVALQDLHNAGAAAWPLPPEVRRLIDDPALAAGLSATERAHLSTILHWPKALLPYARDGHSFLKAKQAEHRALGRLHAEVYVTPPGRVGAFAEELDRDPAAKASLPRLFLEQGPELSSIRFLPDGEPYVEPDGDVSVVPAGHGALAELFPRVKQAFPAADCVLIRNIDNVVGTSHAALAAVCRFLDAQAFVWNAVLRVREALAGDRLEQAAESARQLLHNVAAATPSPLDRLSADRLGAVKSPDLRALWETQFAVFHTPRQLAAGDLSLAAVQRLYNRPLNVLGQVPNSGKDVGGTPCYVSHEVCGADGRDVTEALKLCLELPHASPADRRDFLERPARATHFNPVFVVAEIGGDPRYYARGNRDFWVLAEKTYRGRAVAYFETVLFELLGNSVLANSLFLEIPRILFNPHKSLEDAAQRPPLSWS
jgi:hypothetical protein